MGRCVVCNKFAGPFYKLHKSCYLVYEETRERLKASFSHAITVKQPYSELQNSIESCRPASKFSSDLFASLLTHIWEDHAKYALKARPLDPVSGNYLLEIASNLNINERDVEDYLFFRLSNIEALTIIQQKQSLRPIKDQSIEIEMGNDESLIWIFEGTSKIDQQRYAQNPQTTIFQTIINNLFSKSRYKELETKVETSGKLAITDQNLYYLSEKDSIRIALSDFYSITPMKDGVRIQTTQKSATPSTFITGDGRFTYELIRYVQDM